LNIVEPLAWLTGVLEQVVSSRINAPELERLLPWAWKAEHGFVVVRVGADVECYQRTNR
jgi:hypothetical protein